MNPHVNLQTVSPGYFGVMDIRLVQGRGFTDADTTTAPGVVVVSERAAARLWPNRNPIGQRLRDMSYRVDATAAPDAWQTVVGVVSDVRYRGLTDVRLDLYVPATQSNQRVQYLMVRTTGTSQLVSRAVRSAAHEVDTSFTVGDAIAMSDVVARESAPWRFISRVFVIFGMLALTLAIVGLGAVINLALATRHRELGIRAALGADRSSLTRVIFREALVLVIVGSLVGAAVALALGRTIGSVLIGVPPYDPVSLAAAIAMTFIVGAACCWWSARRAADVAPDIVLRSE